MPTNNLDSAPNEQREEEKIKVVSQSHPQWKSELECVVHNVKRYLSRVLALVDGISKAQWGAAGRKYLVQTKCRMSILPIRHPALQSMCSKD
jgi:hypothetical protein